MTMDSTPNTTISIQEASNSIWELEVNPIMAKVDSRHTMVLVKVDSHMVEVVARTNGVDGRANTNRTINILNSRVGSNNHQW